MIGAPALAVLTATWPRRTLLVALLAFFGLAHLATAVTQGQHALLLTRFAAGLPHGAYFGVAALAAAALSPPTRRARAVGLVMLGLALALLAGAPLATWLGQQFGRRAAFASVGVVALLAAVLIRREVPHSPADAGASAVRELGALARQQVWSTLATAGIGFGGLFCVFSYIKPTLIDVSHLDVMQVPWVLSLFGLGGVTGNLVGARLADRWLNWTIVGTLLNSAMLLAVFGMLARQTPTALVGVFLLGTLVALGPSLQIRLMDVAGDAQTLAAALNHSAFNLANASGAWLGGLAIAAGWGWTSLGWVGSSLAICGLLVFAASVHGELRDGRRR